MEPLSMEIYRPPTGQLLIAPYAQRHALVAEATRLQRRGDIRILEARPVWSRERQLWLMPIERLRPPAPPWIKPISIGGGILLTLAALFGLGVWLVTSLSPLALTVFMVAAVAGLGALARAGARPKVSVTVTTSVTVR